MHRNYLVSVQRKTGISNLFGKSGKQAEGFRNKVKIFKQFFVYEKDGSSRLYRTGKSSYFTGFLIKLTDIIKTNPYKKVSVIAISGYVLEEPADVKVTARTFVLRITTHQALVVLLRVLKTRKSEQYDIAEGTAHTRRTAVDQRTGVHLRRRLTGGNHIVVLSTHKVRPQPSLERPKIGKVLAQLHCQI